MKPTVPYIRINGAHVGLNPEALLKRQLVLADASVSEQCEGCGSVIHETWEIQYRHGEPHLVACNAASEFDGEPCTAVYKIHRPNS